MRAPVYRNLNRPFEILGFEPVQLVILSVLFIAGGEAAEALGRSRFWSFLATLLAAVFLYTFRRFLGAGFLRRLIRFVSLPSSIGPRLPVRLMKEGA